MRGGPKAAAGLLWLALGCSPLPGPQGVLAVVNGEAVTLAQLESERALLGPWAPPDEDLLEDLIDQALILQAGRRAAIRLELQELRQAELNAAGAADLDAVRDVLEAQGLDYQAWSRRVRRAALIDEVVRRQVRRHVEVGPQEVQDHYWENLPRYRRLERRVLRQVFTRSRSEADKAHAELALGEPFDAVARRRGQGPEAAQGGLLGAQALRSLPRPLADAAAKLKPGRHSAPVASPWGWHILKVEAVLPAEAGSLEQAAPLVRARLLGAKEQPAYHAWLARLREQAQIERRPLPGPTPNAEGSPDP